MITGDSHLRELLVGRAEAILEHLGARLERQRLRLGGFCERATRVPGWKRASSWEKTSRRVSRLRSR